MSKQGLIYEIVCNETGERYVGSTFEPTVARRIVSHRKENNMCMSRQIIERSNYSYGLLETLHVNSRDELRMCERKWFDNLECINKVKPFVTQLEAAETIKAYYEANVDKIKAYNKTIADTISEKGKVYREINADKIKQQRKAYRDANADKINAKTRAYRAANPDKMKAKDRAKHLKAKQVKANNL